MAFKLALGGCLVAMVINLAYAATHRDSCVKMYTGLLAALYVPGYVAVIAGWVEPANWSSFYIWYSVPAWMVWILPALADCRRSQRRRRRHG